MKYTATFFMLFNFILADSVSINTNNSLTQLPIKNQVTEDKINQIDKIVEEALKLIGMKYVWGAVGPDKFDCSGFVLYVIEKSLNIKLPRVSYGMAVYNKSKLSFNEIKTGDLVFFDTLNKNRVSHVGIYIGNNKFIHAPNASKNVMVSEINSYYKKKFKWGIRL